LTGHDEIGLARGLRIVAVAPEGRDDHDQQSDDRNQIDLARIMTVVMTMISWADFPAHWFVLPTESQTNACSR
jgi:hypothetical protein